MDDYRNSCLLPAGCVYLTHSSRKGEGGQLFSDMIMHDYDNYKNEEDDARIKFMMIMFQLTLQCVEAKLFSGIMHGHDNYNDSYNNTEDDAMVKVMMTMF